MREFWLRIPQFAVRADEDFPEGDRTDLIENSLRASLRELLWIVGFVGPPGLKEYESKAEDYISYAPSRDTPMQLIWPASGGPKHDNDSYPRLRGLLRNLRESGD